MDKYLVDSGLVQKSGEASKLLAKYQKSFAEIPISPTSHINDIWALVEKDAPNNTVRGAVFELLVGSILVANGVRPFYLQAEVSFVNNARFDILLWEDGQYPISISLKTSLRERYKQAELEAWALKSVHRKAENWLVTMNNVEVDRRRRQLESASEYSYLNGLVLANEAEFDEFIAYLKAKSFSAVKPFPPMLSEHIVDI